MKEPRPLWRLGFIFLLRLLLGRGGLETATDEVGGDVVHAFLFYDKCIAEEAIEPEAVMHPFGFVEAVDICKGEWFPTLASSLTEAHNPPSRNFSFHVLEGIKKSHFGVDVAWLASKYVCHKSDLLFST
ncbi:hypothetical protein A3K34_02615 [candidate division WWE3 bacterium RIFOXYC1_FULL_40_10]|uniref:Uncharacterized protein n=1 Tax=candidate division WWE3 bacterium RIFOXYA2_FULL_46_9 TaxID=1802636 RepID=A0A1F4W2S9_UNCKA|nr:MAG: hypothetical protein A3K58_02615 [candidate division WWE3 bacterium RIFOXYB1_FULL_40_22]OGC61740.1 MAG: hypothetical protein A3K37_02615 [candidate division WWE3 bacterium RIFOXYA1_FULL_40_11]OGC63724.1 MAG: hypothetical protein A2264_05105 [candidate division WWE3 bacterium RIFOXYA2_FULL_46_9]OGC65210.1 MAG: hypothetical protein A2326_02535 [candidate division WWE3 bacterium RIFOXYB2_FULL_41_6]OGC66123.1 MAG: hypothetical protein A3K34_02615 [candidate division WWE3 bacterium RIFOXYC1_